MDFGPLLGYPPKHTQKSFNYAFLVDFAISCLDSPTPFISPFVVFSPYPPYLQNLATSPCHLWFPPNQLDLNIIFLFSQYSFVTRLILLVPKTLPDQTLCKSVGPPPLFFAIRYSYYPPPFFFRLNSFPFVSPSFALGKLTVPNLSFVYALYFYHRFRFVRIGLWFDPPPFQYLNFHTLLHPKRFPSPFSYCPVENIGLRVTPFSPPLSNNPPTFLKHVG